MLAIALSTAKKGQKVAVRLPNGKVKRLIAETDIISSQVFVIGDRVLGKDIAQTKLARTTQFFQSKPHWQEDDNFPYISVFINSNNQLVSTYNNNQRIVGEMPGVFVGLNAVNLTYKGNAIFIATALSQNQTYVISFDHTKIEPVVNIPIIPDVWKSISFFANQGNNANESNLTLPRKLLGNRIYDSLTNTTSVEYYYGIEYLPLTESFIHRKYLVPFGSRSGQYLAESTYSGYDQPLDDSYFFVVNEQFYNHFNIKYFYRHPPDSYTPLTIAPQSYTYNDNRTITNYGTNPDSFSNSEFSWSFAITGQVVALKSGENTGLYPTYNANINQPPPVTDTFGGALVKSITQQKTNESDIAIEFPTVFDKYGNILDSTKITYKSNISRVVKYDSNFTVSGTAVTAWQYTFIQFEGYYYIPYTNTTIDYSGQANVSDITEKHIESEMLIPVPTSDRSVAQIRKYLKKDSSKTVSASVTVNNSPISNNYVSSIPSEINDYTIVSEDTIIYEDLDIEFIFNVGDLGIYREKKLAYVIQEDSNGLVSGLVSHGKLAMTTDAPDEPTTHSSTFTHLELSAGAVDSYDDTPDELFNNVISKLLINYSSYNILKIKDILANFSFYKIAYLDNEPITAYPGWAGSAYTSTPEKIINFFLDSNSDPSIDIRIYNGEYNINYVSKETITTTKSLGQTGQNTTIYERQSYPEYEASSVDLVGQHVVYKQTYQNNTYLTLCRVNSALVSSQTNYGNTSNNPDSKSFNSAQCTIISVKNIKPFNWATSFGSNPLDAFVFTVDGCAIFQYLDPYRTNLIENKGTKKVYLAATMLPVSEKNTQTLLFEYTETGFTFRAVVGGDVNDFNSSPTSSDRTADNWINWFNSPQPTSFW